MNLKFDVRPRDRKRSPSQGLQVEQLEDRQLLSRPISWPFPAATPEPETKTKVARERLTAERSTALAGTVGQRATAKQRLPDLTVWASAKHGYLYNWHIDTDEPSMAGRKLLRLTNAVANVGAGPLELRGGAVHDEEYQEVYQRIYDKNSHSSDRLAGHFVFHPEHGHTHFEDFTEYNLRAVTGSNGVGDIVATGGKVSFCLLDGVKFDGSVPGAPRSERYSECSEFQGISVGWADIYESVLADQWIDITDVPDGTYWLESVVDPSNRIVESDETNNVARIMITLGAQPDDFPDSFASAVPWSLAKNRTISQPGSVFPPGDVDMYSFIATRRGKVKITQIGIAGGIDSVLSVYDSTEQLIATDDDSAGGVNSRIRFRVAAGQRYFVKAAAYGSSTGQYLLSITGPRR